MSTELEAENVYHEAQTAEHVAQLFEDHVRRLDFKSATVGGAEMTKWTNAPKMEAWELLQERLDHDDARFAFLLLEASNRARRP